MWAPSRTPGCEVTGAAFDCGTCWKQWEFAKKGHDAFTAVVLHPDALNCGLVACLQPDALSCGLAEHDGISLSNKFCTTAFPFRVFEHVWII